ncbi:MAG: TolC family protein [Planctomycetes bacterium]|nr:TolC family protein [Planctomycetota bacterium]
MNLRAFQLLGLSLLLATSARGQSPQLPRVVEVQWKSSVPKSAPVILQVSNEVTVPKDLPVPFTIPPKADAPAVLPINLATAFELANVRPLDVQIASQQVRIAAAQYDRAKFLWAPSIIVGADWFRHQGVVQNFQGAIVDQSRSSVMVGGGANAVFGLNDAIFAPLAARQDLTARRANFRAVNNDMALAVAEAYFLVQQARGELAGALVVVKEAEELVRRTKQLAEGLAPPMEATRSRVELARRLQTLATLRENWRSASAELVRLLRLDPAAVVEPIEPADMTIRLIEPAIALDDLIAIGLTSRPELAANQAIVQASLQRLRQEKLRPLVPSLLLRSVGTNPSGSLAYGAFGGGPGTNIGSMQSRFDYDAQVVWELQNFGLGNKARIDERKAEREIALYELLKVQDRIAAEIVQAQAQVISSRDRVTASEPALRDALESLQKNMEGLAQTRRVGNTLILVVRPQEVVAALQALAQANSDYHQAVADFNRAQFRLYRATGHPAQCLMKLMNK